MTLDVDMLLTTFGLSSGDKPIYGGDAHHMPRWYVSNLFYYKLLNC